MTELACDTRDANSSAVQRSHSKVTCLLVRHSLCHKFTDQAPGLTFLTRGNPTPSVILQTTVFKRLRGKGGGRTEWGRGTRRGRRRTKKRIIVLSIYIIC